MCAQSYSKYFCKPKINFESIEKTILEAQRRIYHASRLFEEDKLHREHKTFLLSHDVFLLIAKNSIRNIKKNNQGIYLKKLCLLSYFSLFGSNVNDFCSLSVIKIEVAKYCIVLLLEPEWKAKSENHRYESKKTISVEHLKDYANKTLCYSKFSKDKCSLLLNTGIYNNKTNTGKLTNSICESFTYIGLNLFINQYVLKKIIHASLEWHLYINMQIKHLCFCIHLLQEKQIFFFLHCPEFSVNIVKKISVFFYSLKVNIKSIKCSIYIYIKHLIYLYIFDYMSKNISNYLFKCSNIVIENLVVKVKQRLYHKNTQGFWRVSTYVYSYQLVHQIREMLYLWCHYYSSILSKSKVLKINKIIDHIFYKWQVKQS